jgi:hypothetical protein
MSKYIVSRATHALFAGLTRPGVEFKDTSTARPDGSVLLVFDPEVSERLEAKRFPGESDDELIERVLRTASGGLQ